MPASNTANVSQFVFHQTGHKLAHHINDVFWWLSSLFNPGDKWKIIISLKNCFLLILWVTHTQRHTHTHPPQNKDNNNNKASGYLIWLPILGCALDNFTTITLVQSVCFKCISMKTHRTALTWSMWRQRWNFKRCRNLLFSCTNSTVGLWEKHAT